MDATDLGPPREWGFGFLPSKTPEMVSSRQEAGTIIAAVLTYEPALKSSAWDLKKRSVL